MKYFDFDLTLIRVKPGATFQASVDAPTWSDTTWKALTDPRTGALNTKLELLTFPSALTDATVSGNSVVFKRANEEDKTITLPSSLTDAQERTLAEATVVKKDLGATRVPETITNNEGNTNLAVADPNSYGGTVGTTDGGWTFNKLSSNNNASQPATFKIVYFGHGGSGTSHILIQSDQLSEFTVNILGQSVAFARKHSSITLNGVQTIYADPSSAIDTFFINLLNSGSVTLSVEGYSVVGSNVVTESVTLSDKVKLSGGDGTDYTKLETVTTLEDDDEMPINDFSGNVNGKLTVARLSNTIYGFINASNRVISGISQNLGSLVPASPDDLASIWFSYGSTLTYFTIYVPWRHSPELSQIIIDGTPYNLTKINTNVGTGVTLTDGTFVRIQGVDGYGFNTPVSNLPQSSAGDVFDIKILNKDGTAFYESGTIRAAKQKKVLFGKMKSDILEDVEADVKELFTRVFDEETIEDKPRVVGITPDDNLVLTDHISGGFGDVTTATVRYDSTTIVGYVQSNSRDQSATAGGAISATIHRGRVVAIGTSDGRLRMWSTPTYINTNRPFRGVIQTVIIEVDGATFEVDESDMSQSTYCVRSGGNNYCGEEWSFPLARAFKENETIKIKILDVNGNVFFGNANDSIELKKASIAQIENHLKKRLQGEVLTEEQELILAEADAKTKTFGAVKTPEIVTNNNGRKSLAVASNGAYAQLGSVGEGWTFKKSLSNRDITQPDEFKILYLGYYLADNTTDILVQTDQDFDFTAVVNGTSLNFSTTNSAVTYLGKQTKYNAGDLSSSQLKTMLDSGSVTIFVTGYTVENTTGVEKVLISPKWDLSEVLPENTSNISKPQTILTPEYLKATPNLARDEVRIDSTGTGTLAIGTDTFVDTDLQSAAYQAISIAVKKTDLVGAKFIEVFHAHAPQVLAASSGLRDLSGFDATAKPFSGTFRSDRNYTMEIHRGQNQLGTASTTTDRITFTANTTGGAVYIGEIRIWK